MNVRDWRVKGGKAMIRMLACSIFNINTSAKIKAHKI